MDNLKQLRDDATMIFKSCLGAVDPYGAINRFVHPKENKLLLGLEGHAEAELDLGTYERISIVGAGKATAPMARAIEEMFGDRIYRGIINLKYGFTDELSITEIIEASHPVPDQNGVEGTKKIIDFLHDAGEKDLIFSLISGGGSALLPLPTGDISLEEKQEITRSLLACGASIDEINAVRKHISSSKGGQMARAAFPATVVNLMLSERWSISCSPMWWGIKWTLLLPAPLSLIPPNSKTSWEFSGSMPSRIYPLPSATTSRPGSKDGFRKRQSKGILYLKGSSTSSWEVIYWHWKRPGKRHGSWGMKPLFSPPWWKERHGKWRGSTAPLPRRP